MKEEQKKALLVTAIGALMVLAVVGVTWAFLAAQVSRMSQTAVVETNVSFTDDADPSVGPSNAKVVVRIFSDLQCPGCRDASIGIKYAMAKYKDSVRFIWNSFPLASVHKNAVNAANAARCAEKQGKFWEYKDVLYQKQSEWANLAEPAFQFKAYAVSLQMSASAFETCYATDLFLEQNQQDIQEGQRNHVQATPTFFINNVRRTGSISNEEWDGLLKSALADS